MNWTIGWQVAFCLDAVLINHQCVVRGQLDLFTYNARNQCKSYMVDARSWYEHKWRTLLLEPGHMFTLLLMNAAGWILKCPWLCFCFCSFLFFPFSLKSGSWGPTWPSRTWIWLQNVKQPCRFTTCGGNRTALSRKWTDWPRGPLSITGQPGPESPGDPQVPVSCRWARLEHSIWIPPRLSCQE